MEFSVLQSVYKKDNAVFLDKCLSSIKESTILPYEIVLVKDGELTDELNDVIDKWVTELPIKVVGYEKNQGLAHALNYGLQYVSTEYVARMDSDDYCFPQRFEYQLNFLAKHPNVNICGTGISEFYDSADGRQTRKIRLYPVSTNSKSKTLFKGTPLAHPTLIIKTEILKKFNYSENTMMNEDIDLWFRLILSGYTIYNISEPLLNFRITDGTFKRRSIRKAFNEYKIYRGNLKKLFGFSVLNVYPFIRLLSRFLPYFVMKKLYLSKLRERFLNKE